MITGRYVYMDKDVIMIVYTCLYLLTQFQLSADFSSTEIFPWCVKTNDVNKVYFITN